MAPPVVHVTHDRVQVREGGGCLSVFGLPFFVAGLLMFLALIGVVPMSEGDMSPLFARAILALMAIVFTGVGGTLLFGRIWTTIDGARRTLTRQKGLLVPFHERTFPLDQCTAVSVGFVAGDSDTADRFPVALKARSGADLVVCSFGKYGESQACASAIAQLLRLELEDARSDQNSPRRLQRDA